MWADQIEGLVTRCNWLPQMPSPHRKRAFPTLLLMISLACLVAIVASQSKAQVTLAHPVCMTLHGMGPCHLLPADGPPNQAKLPPSRRIGAGPLGAGAITAPNSRRPAPPVHSVKASAISLGPYKDLTPSDPIALFGKPGLKHVRGIGYQPVSWLVGSTQRGGERESDGSNDVPIA